MPIFVMIPAVGTFVTFPIFSGPLLASAMGEVAGRFETIADPDGKPGATILTDDKAPVEVLGMRAIDNIIAEEAGPYRELLKTEGIAGLLKAVQ